MGKKECGGEIVAPTFAFQSEYHPRMSEIGRVYGSHNWYREVLGPITFGFPSQVVPLQTADFVAHQINKEIEHIEYDELTLQNMGRTLALENATAFNGMHIGGGFGADALRLAIKRFRESGTL
jgi:hypothetical protein